MPLVTPLPLTSIDTVKAVPNCDVLRGVIGKFQLIHPFAGHSQTDQALP